MFPTDLMIDLMHYCRRHEPAEILDIPDVEELEHLFFEHGEYAQLQIRKNAKVRGKTVVVDLRQEEAIYACNRFMIYALYPECNLSIFLYPMENSDVVEIAMGKSILDRSSDTNVGILMLEHGGGGHEAVGTCGVPKGDVDDVLAALLEKIAGS